MEEIGAFSSNLRSIEARDVIFKTRKNWNIWRQFFCAIEISQEQYMKDKNAIVSSDEFLGLLLKKSFQKDVILTPQPSYNDKQISQ